MRSEKGFGLLFLAKESLGLRKLEKTRKSLEFLTRSIHAYGKIPIGRPYVLILANDVSNDVLNVCFADSTKLSVQMPYEIKNV